FWNDGCMIRHSDINQHQRDSLLKRLLKRIAPRALLLAVRDFRETNPNTRSVYVRLRVVRLLGLRRDRPKVTPATKNFLFVCYGNIMRSPMAAGLLEQRVAERGDEVDIRSAGTNAKPGRRAEPRAIAAAVAHGVSLEGHGATLISDQDMHWADVIFAMDHRNETALVHRFPWAEDKIALLGAFALDGDVDVSIPDPYSEDEATLDECYGRLAVAVDEVAGQLADRTEGT
ncbi:MAG: low molecular weight protein-tyrosine-phosphatase, partial [bacterium]